MPFTAPLPFDLPLSAARATRSLPIAGRSRTTATRVPAAGSTRSARRSPSAAA